MRSTCRPHGSLPNLDVIVSRRCLLTLSTPIVSSSLQESTISQFVTSVGSENPGVQAQLSTNENAVQRVVLPFKDEKSAGAVKRQLSDLSNKIDHTLQPVFKNRKICEDPFKRCVSPNLL